MRNLPTFTFGKNAVRTLPAGPLRMMADGGRVSAWDVIKEELPKWWSSDETADLRRGLRQTGLGAAYTFGPGLPMLPSVALELYDQFGREEQERKDAPTPGSFGWIESMLGRDLNDPREETMATASGIAQATPLLKSVPSLYRGIKAAPSAIARGTNKLSDMLGATFPAVANSDPSRRKFLGQAAGLGAAALGAGLLGAKALPKLEGLMKAAPEVVNAAPELMNAVKAASNVGDIFSSAFARAVPEDQILEYLHASHGPDPASLKTVLNQMSEDPSELEYQRYMTLLDDFDETSTMGVAKQVADEILTANPQAFGGADPHKAMSRLLKEMTLNHYGPYEESLAFEKAIELGKDKMLALRHPYETLDELRDIPPETVREILNANRTNTFDDLMYIIRNEAEGMASGGEVVSPAVKRFLEL